MPNVKFLPAVRQLTGLMIPFEEKVETCSDPSQLLGVDGFGKKIHFDLRCDGDELVKQTESSVVTKSRARSENRATVTIWICCWLEV